jgi:hypothetical protein
MSDDDRASSPDSRRDVSAGHVRGVRVGHGANCSSIGSVIDTLFATATVGAAVFAAVVAALRNEEIRVVGREEPEDAPGERGVREGREGREAR